MDPNRWFVLPERVRLPLSHNQWIEVRKRLSVGEARMATTSFVGAYKSDGSRTPNMEVLGLGMMLAYLLDWSARDFEDRPVPVSLDAIKQLDQTRYNEIEAAIEKHVTAIAEEDAEREKKIPASTGAA